MPEHVKLLTLFYIKKSDGKVKAEEVALVSLEKLRKLQFDEIEAELSNRKGYTWIVADAIEEAFTYPLR